MIHRIATLALTAACVVASQHPVQGESMSAGVARIDITPPLEMKASLGGYGERMSQPAEGVHDRLFAKALVLTKGTKKFAVVTADILGFPPSFKKEVVRQLADDKWSGPQIMLLPSHSHTAIEMMQIHPGNKLPIPQLGIFHRELFELTASNLVKVIRQAQATMVPVQVGTSSTELNGWNSNRRTDSGAVDRQLTVTRIDTDASKPLAVLVNWTAHPTMMAAEDMWYSGGWPGHMQRTLESLIGSGVTVMYYNGAEGDQRPVARPGSGTSHWERAERYGRELALECYELFGRVAVAPDVLFSYHRQPVPLPSPMAHPEFLLSGGAEYGLTKTLMSKLLSSIVPTETGSCSLRLGELVIVGVPGEITAELGLDIKRSTKQITGAGHPVIGGLADEWISYILTSAEYEKGGYEASVSLFGPTLGNVIRDGVVTGTRQLAK